MRKYLGFSDPVLLTSYGLALAKLLAARGIDETRFLERSEVNSAMLRSPKARLSFEQMLHLVRNALELSGDRALGLEYGRQITVSTLGVVGLATMSQPTLGAAIAISERYQRVLVPYVKLAATTDEQHAHMAIEPEFPLSVYKPFVMEAMVTSLAHIGHFLIGKPLPGLRVTLDYPDPGYGERYSAALGCEVVFDAPRVELRVEKSALAIPLAYDCEPTARMTEELCERALAPLLGQDGVVHQVRTLLQTEGERFPNVRELAKALHTSERSLRRALSAHGTSYQELRDELRMRLALHYLTATATPVEEVARTVGFTSSRSFRRALKRWTGKSPSSVRLEGDN